LPRQGLLMAVATLSLRTAMVISALSQKWRQTLV